MKHQPTSRNAIYPYEIKSLVGGANIKKQLKHKNINDVTCRKYTTNNYKCQGLFINNGVFNYKYTPNQ